MRFINLPSKICSIMLKDSAYFSYSFEAFFKVPSIEYSKALIML